MIRDLVIGLLPVTFKFTQADIIKVDERKKVVILADTVTRTFKDTLDDGNDSTEDIVLENTFQTLRQVILPYENVIVGNTPLFDYMKGNMSGGFTVNIQASADSVTDSKIILSGEGVTTA